MVLRNCAACLLSLFLAGCASRTATTTAAPMRTGDHGVEPVVEGPEPPVVPFDDGPLSELAEVYFELAAAADLVRRDDHDSAGAAQVSMGQVRRRRAVLREVFEGLSQIERSELLAPYDEAAEDLSLIRGVLELELGSQVVEGAEASSYDSAGVAIDEAEEELEGILEVLADLARDDPFGPQARCLLARARLHGAATSEARALRGESRNAFVMEGQDYQIWYGEMQDTLDQARMLAAELRAYARDGAVEADEAAAFASHSGTMDEGGRFFRPRALERVRQAALALNAAASLTERAERARALAAALEGLEGAVLAGPAGEADEASVELADREERLRELAVAAAVGPAPLEEAWITLEAETREEAEFLGEFVEAVREACVEADQAGSSAPR